LWCCCGVVVVVLWCCCGGVVVVLWWCCGVVVVLLWCCCGVVVVLLWCCCVVVVVLLCCCCGVVVVCWMALSCVFISLGAWKVSCKGVLIMWFACGFVWALSGIDGVINGVIKWLFS
jgi:hypothetical protein